MTYQLEEIAVPAYDRWKERPFLRSGWRAEKIVEHESNGMPVVFGVPGKVNENLEKMISGSGAR